MEKIKNLFSFVDKLLEKFRKIFVNTLTFLFLVLITFGFFLSLGSLFDSNKVETKGQVLYLEPSGVIVDKAITGGELLKSLRFLKGPPIRLS